MRVKPNYEKLREEIKNELESELYYKTGESTTLHLATGGFITAGGKEIHFTITLPKRMDNVTPTIESGNTYIRIPAGGYIMSGVDILNNITSQQLEKNGNILKIKLTYNTAFSVNNVPLGIQIDYLKIAFK